MFNVDGPVSFLTRGCAVTVELVQTTSQSPRPSYPASRHTPLHCPPRGTFISKCGGTLVMEAKIREEEKILTYLIIIQFKYSLKNVREKGYADEYCYV